MVGYATIGNLRPKKLDDQLKTMSVGETAEFELQVLPGGNIKAHETYWLIYDKLIAKQRETVTLRVTVKNKV